MSSDDPKPGEAMPLTGLLDLSLRISSRPLPSGSSMSLIRRSTSASEATRRAEARFAGRADDVAPLDEHRREDS